jgi:outer membrane protein insertion porin family
LAGRGSIPIAWGKAVVSQLATACGKSRLFYPRRRVEVGLVALLILAAGAPALLAGARQATSAGQQQAAANSLFVERIDFEGNRKIRRDVLMARIFTRTGDPFNATGLDRDYHALWNTGYFDDIYITVANSTDNPNGRIVTFHVKERATIRSIQYNGLKSISESDILDAYKDRKVSLTQDSPLDYTKIMKAQVVIRDLLSAHGRQFATVTATYQQVQATNSVILTFNINEGAKVKVGTITITGNTHYSSRKLIRTMKHSRPYGFDAKIFAMNVMAKTFDREGLNEDMEVGIRSFYQNEGYFEVLVDIQDPPGLKTVDVNKKGIIPLPIPIIGSDHGKATNIPIKIVEGEQFRMGKLFIVNADPERGLQLKHDFLVKAFPLKEGDILNVDKIRKAIEAYTKLYGQFGFMDFTAEPAFDVDHVKHVVNVTLRFSEQKPYYIHRINISGNVTTRDKVIRRELLLDEGDLYNNQRWEVSILRLNQLGFFEQLKPETAATVTRNVKQSTVDLNLKVKEKQKQSISFTGGVSGISGAFIGLTYQTNNFLGLGETLTLSSQFGTVQRAFQIGFTEPYLLDRPLATGFTLFSSRYNFDQARQTSLLLGERITLSPDVAENYNQNSKGFTAFTSYPIKRFSHRGTTRLGVSYGYTDTSIQAFSQAANLLFSAIQFQSVAGPSALNGIHQSNIKTTLSYNSVDSPIYPHAGKSATFSFGVEGGPLGGNTKAVSELFSFSYFRPNFHRRNVIALRFLAAHANSYDGSELPPFERYYAGGETDLRGFDVQTVSPIAFIPVSTPQTLFYSNPTVLNAAGQPTTVQLSIPTLSYTITFPGGDTETIFNGEYRIPIYGEKVGISAFFDAGANGALERNQLDLNQAGLTSLQQQFPDFNFGNRLQLAPGSNFRPRSSVGLELVIQLPIVQVPFRLYYAYNYLRYDRFIVAPVGDFNAALLPSNLPPGVLQDQILPQLNHIASNPAQFYYLDPLHTFRFTVSRTF